jgi:hypothetical protein
MAGFATYDALIAAISAGQVDDRCFYKQGFTPQAAGQWETLWKASGSPGAGADAAATPGAALSGTISSPLAGAINYANAAPDQRHLLTYGATSSLNLTLLLYDRLYSCGSVPLTSTGPKTLNNGTISLPRYTDGLGVVPILEITTPTTTTAAVVNLNKYTNTVPTALRSGPNVIFPSTATVIHWMCFLPLQAGDLGCQSVEELYVTTATTNGVCAVTLIKPLAILPIVSCIGNERDLVLQIAALPRIYDGACLALAFLAPSNAPIVWGQLRVAWD